MNKYFKVFALLAAGAMILSVAVAGSAASDGTNSAAIAKKGCKKGKKGADAAKKKCKKKKKKKPSTPAPAPATPTVRVTLTWSNASSDLDLLVWDTSGQKGSVEAGVGNPIPQTVFSADDTNGGTETFTDQQSPSGRQFAYGVCSDSVSSSTTWSLTMISAAGLQAIFSDSSPMSGPFTTTGDNARYTYTIPPSFNPGPGGANGWCTNAGGTG